MSCPPTGSAGDEQLAGKLSISGTQPADTFVAYFL